MPINRDKKITWITNATCLTQNSNRDVVRTHLRIENGIIESFQENARPEKTDEVIDAQGLLILPGLIQAHVHLCQSLFRNLADDLELLDWLEKRIWPLEASHDEQSLRTSAELGIFEMLSSGTTCILDMATIRNTEAILEVVQETGIRANVGKCLMDNSNHNPPYLNEDPREALLEANQLLKEWHGKENDRIRMSLAPRFAISCSENLLKEVSALAKKEKLIIHTHACENQSEIELVSQMTGMRNIEYLHAVGLTEAHLVIAHSIWLNSKELEIIRETASHVVHCPGSNLKLASGIADLPKMLRDQISISLGTDGPACNNRLSLLDEMRLAALIHKPSAGPKAVRAVEVLDMATRGGAQALGWQDAIGSIEVGKKADLVGLEQNSLENLVPKKLQDQPGNTSIVDRLLQSKPSCVVDYG